MQASDAELAGCLETVENCQLAGGADTIWPGTVLLNAWWVQCPILAGKVAAIWLLQSQLPPGWCSGDCQPALAANWLLLKVSCHLAGA